MFCFSSPLPFYFFDFCPEVCRKSGLFVCHTPVNSNLVVRLFCSKPSTLSLLLLFWRRALYVLSTQMIIYQNICHLYCLPPAVFRERLPFSCGHCRRFGLQQNVENSDVEGEEAGKMLFDEVGPLMYNGLFIGRGWTISCKDQKRKDQKRKDRKRFTKKKIWTKVTNPNPDPDPYSNPDPSPNPYPNP